MRVKWAILNRVLPVLAGPVSRGTPHTSKSYADAPVSRGTIVVNVQQVIEPQGFSHPTANWVTTIVVADVKKAKAGRSIAPMILSYEFPRQWKVTK